MVKVKICGHRTPEDLAASRGADVVGFLVGAPWSERNLSVRRAEALIREVPPFTQTALVTPSSDVEEIVEMVDRAEPHVLQIHTELPPREIEAIRRKLPRSIRIFALLSVSNDADTDELLSRATMLRDLAIDAVLLDSKLKDGSGGTGVTHDWALSRQVVESLAPFPVILAGGLAPENVGEAVATVQPYAVDVATGVEDENGAKSERKVSAFLAALQRSNRPRTTKG